MRRRDDYVSRTQMEMALLQFLCCTTNDGAARQKLLRTLAQYVWSNHDNALFFDCICHLFERDRKHILANLPAELTRRGFPDMPYEILAEPAGLNSASALALAETLLRSSKSEK